MSDGSLPIAGASAKVSSATTSDPDAAVNSSMFPPTAATGPTLAALEAIADAADDPALNGGKDPMNALWSFQGHRLSELQPASKNPHSQSHTSTASADEANTSSPSSVAVALGPRDVDQDGHAVMFGSCGRDKRYARCSVCYFRGLRCNTAHYCACCQRPVCIRPRKYPGEEHPKICWNVLHMDKDMIQRVEKKKKRKLQAMAASAVASSAPALGTALAPHPPPLFASVGLENGAKNINLVPRHVPTKTSESETPSEATEDTAASTAPPTSSVQL